MVMVVVEGAWGFWEGADLRPSQKGKATGEGRGEERGRSGRRTDRNSHTYEASQKIQRMKRKPRFEAMEATTEVERKRVK